MTDFKNLFEQAQMAEAAYANFIGAGGSVVTNATAVALALQARGFKDSQATAFTDQWTVIHKINGVSLD